MRLNKDDIDAVIIDGTVVTANVYKIEGRVYNRPKWTEEDVKNLVEWFKSLNPHVVVETYVVHYEEDCDGTPENWIDIYFSFIDWYKNAKENIKLRFKNEKDEFYISYPFEESPIEMLKNKRILVVNKNSRDAMWKDTEDITGIQWEK